MPIEEASAQVIEHMNSRVPVYDETRGPEHIVGVVYSKDLARLMFFRPKAQRLRLRLSPGVGRFRGGRTRSDCARGNAAICHAVCRTQAKPGHARCACGT